MAEQDEFVPTLTHATERDVDLVLVEEFRCNLPFARMFAQRAGIGDPVDRVRVLHSVRRMQERREIDIQVNCFNADEPLPRTLLIENKLTETEQPGQSDSYLEECNVLVQSGRSRIARAVLVCPNEYARTWPAFAEKFHAVVHYEEVGAWLEDRAKEVGGELGCRLQHHSELIDQAVSKYRRGWEPVLVEKVGGFNARYVSLLGDIAPNVLPGSGLANADAKPADSVSMIFDHKAIFAQLPAHIRPRRFAHEFGRGRETRANYVAVTFAGWGRHYREHRDRLESDLAGTPYGLKAAAPNVKRPRPGLVVHMQTPPIDNQGDFDDQAENIRSGIMAAEEMRQWVLANVNLLEEWSSILSGQTAGKT